MSSLHAPAHEGRSHHSSGVQKAERPLSSNYKGFPTFVKQKTIVVSREAIDHQIPSFSAAARSRTIMRLK